MNLDALFAYFHLVSIFVLICSLWNEFLLYQRPIDLTKARKLLLTDGIYGIASILVVGTGFLRALYYATKGWEFYQYNPLFWAKAGLFLGWAFLSLPGTFHFFSFKKNIEEGKAPEITDAKFRRIRLLIILQMCLVPVIPLIAVFLARGYGN